MPKKSQPIDGSQWRCKPGSTTWSQKHKSTTLDWINSTRCCHHLKRLTQSDSSDRQTKKKYNMLHTGLSMSSGNKLF